MADCTCVVYHRVGVRGRDHSGGKGGVYRFFILQGGQWGFEQKQGG
jgi:hypothetical protein